MPSVARTAINSIAAPRGLGRPRKPRMIASPGHSRGARSVVHHHGTRNYEDTNPSSLRCRLVYTHVYPTPTSWTERLSQRAPQCSTKMPRRVFAPEAITQKEIMHARIKFSMIARNTKCKPRDMTRKVDPCPFFRVLYCHPSGNTFYESNETKGDTCI